MFLPMILQASWSASKCYSPGLAPKGPTSEDPTRRSGETRTSNGRYGSSTRYKYMIVIGEFFLDGSVLLFISFSEFEAEYVFLLPLGMGFSCFPQVHGPGTCHHRVHLLDLAELWKGP